MKRGIIGIDIGGTKTRVALFDEKFTVIKSEKFRTHVLNGRKEFLQQLKENIEKFRRLAKQEELDLAAAGIGTSGTVNKEATMMESTPVRFLEDFPLVEDVRKKLKVPVYLGNDVHMGLYGEHRLGAARGLKHVIGVFFGTGVGAAVIIDGKLHLGASRHAGDIGHFLVTAIGPLAGSEREGTLNDFASMSALAGKAAMLAARRDAPHLMKSVGADVTRIRSKTLAEAIEGGDKEIERMVRSRAHMAGIVLSNIVDFLNPDMVVLGGGLVEAMPSLYEKEVCAGICHHIVDEVRKPMKVVVAQLKKYAVAAGAAKMAWDTFVVHE